MNERIQQVLDGEMARSALTDAEAAELAEMEIIIGRTLRSVPTQPLPDLAAAVMARVQPAGRAAPVAVREPWRRLIDWFWLPRPVSLQWRPAYALAMLVVMATGTLTMRSLVQAPAAVSEAQSIMIQFRLDAPDAKQVALAGNFTDWQPSYQLTRTATGVWTVIVPLPQGVHKYAFVVDGETWQPDPLAPSVADGFGGENSQIAVLSPDMIEQT